MHICIYIYIYIYVCKIRLCIHSLITCMHVCVYVKGYVFLRDCILVSQIRGKMFCKLICCHNVFGILSWPAQFTNDVHGNMYSVSGGDPAVVVVCDLQCACMCACVVANVRAASVFACLRLCLYVSICVCVCVCVCLCICLCLCLCLHGLCFAQCACIARVCLCVFAVCGSMFIDMCNAFGVQFWTTRIRRALVVVLARWCVYLKFGSKSKYKSFSCLWRVRLACVGQKVSSWKNADTGDVNPKSVVTPTEVGNASPTKKSGSVRRTSAERILPWVFEILKLVSIGFGALLVLHVFGVFPKKIIWHVWGIVYNSPLCQHFVMTLVFAYLWHSAVLLQLPGKCDTNTLSAAHFCFPQYVFGIIVL